MAPSKCGETNRNCFFDRTGAQMDFPGAVGLRSTIIEQNEMTFILDALSKDSHLS